MASANSNDPLRDFTDALERRVRQRKMVDLSIEETSGVSRPAHGVEGWLILKSSEGGHRHRADVDYLAGMAAETGRVLYNTDTISPGGPERPITADGSRGFGRSSCGCLYFRSPETVTKAESEEYVNRVEKAAPKRTWTPEEAAFLTAEANKLLGWGA